MSKRDHSGPEHYRTITDECAHHIIELHKHHPQLGHDGLLKLLADNGYKVDAREYDAFLEQHKVHGERWEVAWGYIPGRFKLRFFGAVYLGGRN